MSILIRGGLVLPLDSRKPVARRADLLIEADTIAKVGDGLDDRLADTVIDGRDMLVMPGLVNAHAHSFDALLKGRYDNMPLEVWIPRVAPVVDPPALSPRLVYLRTMLMGMEALRGGATCIHDDAADGSGLQPSLLEAMFSAYDDLGIRASCSVGAINRPLLDALPFAGEASASVRATLGGVPRLEVTDYLEICDEAVRRFHGRSGRLRVVIAPSAPQWCTDDFLVGSAEFARRHDLGFHLHVLETKVQAVAARSGPSGSVVAHMRDLGVLSEHTTLAHAVWVSDQEIGILGESRCTVVHNPASNLKLASGLAPVPQLAAAKVNLALGTDNPSAGDAVRMLDAARLAALLSEAWALNPESWLTAGAVLEAATMGGARSLRIAHEIGSIEPGKKADLLLMNLRSLAFTPLNDVLNQIVYCDSGASIEYVIVAGRVVVKHGRIQTVDEEALLEEIAALAPEFQASQARAEDASEALTRFFGGVVRRANRVDLGFERRLVPSPPVSRG